MNNFLAAIATKFTDSDLYNDVSGRVYLDEADSPDYPRVVYSVIAAPKEKTFTEQYVNILLQVSLYSAKSAGMAVMTTMYSDLVALLDEGTLDDLTGYTLVWMREENLVPMVEKLTTPLPDGSTGLLSWHVDFEIRLSKD